jgi:hypothetical protein
MTETPDHRTDNTEPERPNPSPGNTAPAAEGDTAPTEHQMSPDQGGSAATGEISDEQLPEDLQPSDDNPLAQPADEGADQRLSVGRDNPQE